MSKLTEIYNDYISMLNHQKTSRYVGKEEWFHSSSAGLCARKHYFSAVEKVDGKEDGQGGQAKDAPELTF